MAKLKPPNNTKMTKQHYEWLAWSIRQVIPQWLESINLNLSMPEKEMTKLAELFAYECKGTNPRFDRDKFVSAVVNGEW